MTTLTVRPRVVLQGLARAPLDTLSRIFLALARHYNTNSNQILVVAGDLDLDRLRGAVGRAVQKFEHVLLRLDGSGQAWLPADVPVREAHFDGACTLRDEAFRDLLMRLSDSHRIDWRHAPASQVFLLRSADRQTSCVYLNSAHAAADAASDCMLVEEIIAQYGQPRPVRPVAPYAPLQDVAPTWFGLGARVRRLMAAMWDIVCTNLSSDRGLRLPASGRYGYGPHEASARFHTDVLPADEAEGARAAARRAGVSLNTLFSAALIRVMAAGQARERGVRLSIVVSLRSLLPAAGREDAFGNHVATCTIRKRAAADGAASLVRDLHRQVQAVKTQRLPLEVGRFELALPFLALTPLQPFVRRAMARAQITNVCYSNPGVLKQDFSYFGCANHPILEYTGLGCLVTPYDLMFYTTTVNGRTQLDALYRHCCVFDVAAELIRPFRASLRELVAELSDPIGLAAEARAA